MKKVRCIDDDGGFCLELGKIYDVIKESDIAYFVYDKMHSFDPSGWFKYRFVEVSDKLPPLSDEIKGKEFVQSLTTAQRAMLSELVIEKRLCCTLHCAIDYGFENEKS